MIEPPAVLPNDIDEDSQKISIQTTTGDGVKLPIASHELVENILCQLANKSPCGIRTSYWQAFVAFLLSTYCLFGVATVFGHYFTYDIDYHCLLPSNISMEEAIPSSSSGFAKCYVYKNFDKATGVIVPCPNGYNHSGVNTSFISTFNLYCLPPYLDMMDEIAMYIGVLIGSILYTVVGDRYGKRPLFLGALWIGALAGFASAVAPRYWVLCLSRFVAGMCFQVYGISGYVLAVELYSTRDRAIPCIWLNMMWPAGMLALGLFAYLIRYWRYFYLAMAVPMVMTIGYYWLIPESVYWLAEKRRNKCINDTIRKAYNFNKIDECDRIWYNLNNMPSIDDLTALTKNNEDNDQPSVASRIKTQLKLMGKSSSFMYAFMTSSLLLVVNVFLYNGLTLAADAFGKDVYFNWAMTSIVEFPAILLAGPFIEKFGRRVCSSLSCLLLVVVFMIFAFIRNETALIVLNHTTKFLISLSYTVVWLYTPEIFPTSHRSFGFGMAISFSKIAAICSPMLGSVLANYRTVSNVILSITSLACALMPLWLWETENGPLPESLEDLPKLKTCGEPFLWRSSHPNARRDIE